MSWIGLVSRVSVCASHRNRNLRLLDAMRIRLLVQTLHVATLTQNVEPVPPWITDGCCGLTSMVLRADRRWDIVLFTIS